MLSVEEINKAILELRNAGISVNEISDGYHTFGDYKDMRNRWFISTLNSNPTLSWKSMKHFDEENDPMYDGDFIAGISTPRGMATQHLKMKYWDKLHVQELDRAPEYDGYTEEDVKNRIDSIEKQDMIVTLDEYKEYLINFYRWDIDSSKEMKKDRTETLEKRYPDQYLQKIIDDTYSFIKDIFASDTVKKDYCKFEVGENSSSSISLGIHGGGYSDTIYIDLQDRNISERILHKVFGNHFIIWLQCEEEEYDAGDDITGVRCYYSLRMQNFPDNMDEIKEKLFGEVKKLIKENGSKM